MIWLATAYAAWCGAAYLLQDRLLFPGGGDMGSSARPPASGEAVWLGNPDGSRVEAWFLRGDGCSADAPGAAVLYAHGNGELINMWPATLAPYRRMGISVLLLEYRGYGRSTGTPSQGAIVSDAERFYDLVAARADVDPARIIFHGRSLGGGVVAALAALHAPAAVILESTFTNVGAMFRRFGVPAFVCTNPFPTDEVVAELRRPLLIFHGTQDGVVPVAHGRELHRLAPGSEYVETDGGHNDFPTQPAQYWETIRSFLSRHGVIAASVIPS